MAFPILGTPKPQFFDSSGSPLASGTLTIVEPSTDVNKATYPTYDDAEAATNANANPLTLDSRGEPASGLWGLDGEDYKITLKDSLGNTVWTVDDIFNSNQVFRVTSAEVTAGVTITDMQYPPGDIRRYGAVIDGTTDDLSAWQAALDQNNQGGEPVTWTGNSAISAALSVYNRTKITGAGRTRSTLTYTGSAQAFVNATPAARIFDVCMRDFLLNDTGTGTIGLDLQRVSNGHFENLTINGFATSVEIDSPTSGHSVYNRFHNVIAQNATTGFLITGTSSNSNSFFGCRANVCTTGVQIDGSNQNTFIGCQFEVCTTGVTITASNAPKNMFALNRFESNTEDWNVGAGVAETLFLQNFYVDGDLLYTDGGTRTQIMELQGNASLWQLISALPSTSGTPWLFERETNGGSNVPAFILRDSVTSTGTPTTLQIEIGRGAGHAIRVMEETGTTEAFGVLGNGRIRTNQDVANTNTPSGATAAALPIYNETGTLIGYVPVYAAQW